jgi:hypothetical protein
VSNPGDAAISFAAAVIAVLVAPVVGGMGGNILADFEEVVIVGKCPLEPVGWLCIVEAQLGHQFVTKGW